MKPRSYWPLFMKILVGVGAVVALLTAGWRHFQTRYYLALLPAALAVEGVHALHVENGLREGCGVVIYDLTPAMAQAMQSNGIQALAKAREGRGGWLARHVRYSAWQSTPYAEHEADGTALALEDRWLVGLSCSDLGDAWANEINKALSSPGAFVSTSAEGGLIVIPARRVVVLSFMG